MNIKKIFVSFLIITSMLMSNVHAADNVANIYVSVNGSNSGDGTFSSPYKTLEYAKSKVAEIKGSYSGVNVNIMAGTYNVSDLKFSAGDSGSTGAKIVWKAYNNDKVILTSERKIDNSRITDVNTDATRKIPMQARGNVKQVKLTAEEISAIGPIRYTGQRAFDNDSPAYLTQDGEMFEIAGYPNKVSMTIDKSDIKLTDTGYIYTINDERVNRWSEAKDAYLLGNPTYEWYEDTLRIANITGSKITTAEGGGFHFEWGGATQRIVNLVEEIDYPGEFYIDRQEGYLYFYPIDSIADSSFALVTSQKPLMTFNTAQHISFENLTLEGTCSTGVIINNSNYITFKNCELKNIGKNAIDINDSKNTTIEGAHIHDIGKQGITILEEDKEDYLNLTPNNNIITNCHIEKYGQILRRNCNAVYAYGLGDTISHNRIHAADHSAIMFGGNNNIIEYNDIYDVLNNAEDAGAVYGGRSWVDGGTEIRYNYIHDNPYSSAGGAPRSGVYLDDSFAGTKIYGNVFANMNAGIKLHGSNYNDIQNNVFINLKSSVRLGNPNGDSDNKIRNANNAINTLLKKGENSFKTNKGYNALSNYYFANTLYGRYFAKYDPYDTTGKYSLWNTKFPYLENFVNTSGNHMSPQGNVIKNNATYTCGQPQNDGVNNSIYLVTSDLKSNNPEVSNNSRVSTSKDVANNGVLDITEIGIQGETSLTLNDFGVVYPQNKSYVDPDGLVLIWDEDSGAQEYHIVVSKNADLSSPIVDEIVQNAYFELEGATLDTKYYWTVEGKINHHLYNENTKQINEGIMRFSTRDLNQINYLTAISNDNEGVVSITALTSDIDGAPFTIGIWPGSSADDVDFKGESAICIDQGTIRNGRIDYIYKMPKNALSGEYYVQVRNLNDNEILWTTFEFTNNASKTEVVGLIDAHNFAEYGNSLGAFLDDCLKDIDTSKGVQYDRLTSAQKAYVVGQLEGYTVYNDGTENDFESKLSNAFGKIEFLSELKNESKFETAQAEMLANYTKFGITYEVITKYNALTPNLKEYASLCFRESVKNAVIPSEISGLFASAVSAADSYMNSEEPDDPTDPPSVPSGNNRPSGVGNVTGGMSIGGITLDPVINSGEAFTDLGSVEWARTAITTLAEKGVINGKGNKMFAPLDKVTREEYLKMIMIAFDIETVPADLKFEDVDKDAWYYTYVAQAVSYGIINGISDTEFGTGKNITRQDAAVILSRVIEKDKYIEIYTVDANFKFNDIDKVSDYASTAVEALGKAKIFSGKENNMFDPFGQTTRAEAAMIIYNLLYK